MKTRWISTATKDFQHAGHRKSGNTKVMRALSRAKAPINQKKENRPRKSDSVAPLN